MKMASSVELGPGIRLAAPKRSRNLSDESHRRCRTISFSMMATCAAGPPKAVKPRRRKRTATSASFPRDPVGRSASIALLRRPALVDGQPPRPYEKEKGRAEEHRIVGPCLVD